MRIENISRQNTYHWSGITPAVLPSIFPTLSFVTFFAFVITANWANAQSTNDLRIELRCHDKILPWMAEHKVPTVGGGVIEDGKLKEVKVFGELRKGVPAPVNTIFGVASLTKPVTAIVALKLVNAGKWDLDEPRRGNGTAYAFLVAYSDYDKDELKPLPYNVQWDTTLGENQFGSALFADYRCRGIAPW